MDLLPLNFRALRLCGIWYEANEKLSFFRITYRFIVLVIIFYFTFTLTIETSLMRVEGSARIESIFLTFTYLSVCLKIANFVLRRNEMLSILKDLRKPCCSPRNEIESAILSKHSRTVNRLFITLLAFVSTDVAYFLSIFISRLINGNLEFAIHTYHFYDTSTPKAFAVTAFLQLSAVVYSVIMNISFDTMGAGLLMLVTGQFEINAYRLTKLEADNDLSMKDCIVHNSLVHGIVEKVESFVIGVVIPFLLFSLLSVCASIFQASKYDIISLDFLKLFTFATCILLQVLIYCWFGNELMLKSEAVANAAYHSNWVLMNPKKRRTLSILMICNRQGRIISYGGQCALNLETFLWILKTSYATVNLLHQINS